MPTRSELLATPYKKWGQLPKVLVRREIYDESDEPGIVRWEVFVDHRFPPGHEDRFRFTLFSKQYDSIVGIGHAEMAGKSVFEALSPHDAVKVSFQYEECVKAQSSITYPEYLEVGGIKRWWKTTLKPKWEGQEIWKLIGSSHQINSIEADLRDAIATGGLTVHYQPICELGVGQIVGYEALIRHSAYTPAEFLPIAKRAGLISPITTFVIQEALATLKTLSETLWIAVNVSDCTFEKGLRQAVEESGVTAKRLRFEITEDTDLNAEVLSQFQAVGVVHPLEFDDFGDDSSNLSWLGKVNAVAIKLDRQFVTDAYKRPNAAAICRAAIQLAKEHNPPLQVIVEGVETLEDVRFMHELGADYGQGWHFGKAQPKPRAPFR